MQITQFIFSLGLFALLPFKISAQQYYIATGEFLAIMEMPKTPTNLSHKDYIRLENELGQRVDGIVKQDGNLYAFNVTHPVAPKIRFTKPYCRMAVPQDHSYFYITPFNEQPDLFSAPAYVRFKCVLFEE